MLTGHIPYDGVVRLRLPSSIQNLRPLWLKTHLSHQALESNVVIKATARSCQSLSVCFRNVCGLVQLSLSYNRRNEPKLVFDDTVKADTKTLPKKSHKSTLTSIPKSSGARRTPSAKETKQPVAEPAPAPKPAKRNGSLKARYMILLASLLLVCSLFGLVLFRAPAAVLF